MSDDLQPFPFVEVSGGPRDRGQQYGRIAADRISGSVELYSTKLRDLGLTRADCKELIGEHTAAFTHFGPHHLEEMRGIAEGAGVDLEDIALINARTEIVAKARVKMGLVADDPDGCTGVVVMPDRSATGRLIHAQNWDWHAECAKTAIVLKVTPETGVPFMTFTEAGGLARCGLNAAGVAITANYLESDLDYTRDGVPLPLIRRFVLEQEHVALAMRAVAITPKACANNMIVSHKAGWAIDFECAPSESFHLLPQDGLIVHANHWQSPVARGKIRECGLASSPDSLYRDWRVSQLFNNKRELTDEDVKAALFDDFGTPYAVCRPPRYKATTNLSATVAMIVMNTAAGTMDIAPLPGINRNFTRYSLHDKMAAA